MKDWENLTGTLCAALNYRDSYTLRDLRKYFEDSNTHMCAVYQFIWDTLRL